MARRRNFDKWLSEGQKLIAERVARKEQLEAELAEINRQLEGVPGMIGTVGAAPRRGRPPGRPALRGGRGRRAAGGTRRKLPDMVQEVLDTAGGPLTIKEIENMVLSGGYQTRAQSIYNAVYTALRNVGAKKVGRGQYVTGRKR
jgi:hypothetical protein